MNRNEAKEPAMRITSPSITRRTLLTMSTAAAVAVVATTVDGAARATPAAAADPMPIAFEDHFDRADGTVGNGWSSLVGTWEISSTLLAGGVVGFVSSTGNLSVDNVAIAPSAGGFSDDFNRPDGPVGPAWTARSGSWALAGNRLVTVGSGPWAMLTHDALQLGAPWTVSATLRTTTGSGSRWNGIALNVQPGSTTGLDYYVLRFASDGRWMLLEIRGSNTGAPRVHANGTLAFAPEQDIRVEVACSTPGHFEIEVRDLSNNPLLEEEVVIPTEKRVITTAGPGSRLLVQSDFDLDDRFAVEASFRTLDPTTTRWCGVAFHVQPGAGTGHDFLLLRFAPDGRWQFLRAYDSAIGSSGVIASGTLVFEAGADVWVEIAATPAPGVYTLLVSSANWTKLLEETVNVPAPMRLNGGHAGFWSSAGNISVGFRADRNEARAAVWRPLVLDPVDGPPYTLPNTPATVLEVSSPGTCWPGHRVPQALLTAGIDQYVSYYDASREMTIAHRDIGTTSWSTEGLGSTIGWDSHNYLTMATDRDGLLHLAGNMHYSPMTYFRMTSSADITSIVQIPVMVDSGVESRVTYPRFTKAPDGSLLFIYRDGSSSDAVWYVNIYDETTSSWSPYLNTPLFDGSGSSNPYSRGPHGPHGGGLGPDGWYHMAYMWRVAPGLQNNEVLCYARSTDLITWENSDGDPVTVPITYGTGDIVDPALAGEGLHNAAFNIGFDHLDHPVLTYLKYDAVGNSALFIARRLAGEWASAPLTDWDGRFYLRGGGTAGTPISVGPARTLPDGNLRVDWSCLGFSRTTIVDYDTLTPITELPTPVLTPSAVTAVGSTFPGMGANTASDLGTSPGSGQRFLLKWESLSGNRDRPVDPPLPDPEPISVFRLQS